MAMTAAVTQMATALKENQSGGVPKLEKKAVKVTAGGKDTLVKELLKLEALFGELQFRTDKARWNVFRGALEGRAETLVSSELLHLRLMPKDMGTLSEEAYGRLLQHMDALLRNRVGLTEEFEGELAMDAVRIA